MGGPGGLIAPSAYQPASAAGALERADPVRLRIPRIGVDTELLQLGLNADRTLQVPPDTADAPAGWYRNLASPGEVGPAVIVGHLDSPDHNGVFFNLGGMRAGDDIVVDREDGSTVVFTTDMVIAYPQDAFPTAGVYGATGAPALRLVTCGGEFAPGSGYSDSIVVFASLTDAVPAPESEESDVSSATGTNVTADPAGTGEGQPTDPLHRWWQSRDGSRGRA